MAGWQISTRLYKRPWLLAVAAVAGLILSALLAPVEEERVVPAPQESTARYSFGDSRSVGQSFAAPAGLTAIRIPIGRVEDASGPLILHIREDYFGEDIRTSSIFQPDGKEVVFHFPLLMKRGRLIWVLEAPHSPDKTYWVFREVDATAFVDGGAFVKGVPIRGNFAFTQVYKHLVIRQVWSSWRAGVQSWELLPVAIGVGVSVAVGVLWRPLRVRTDVALAGVILMGVGTRLWFAGHFPAIIDEGAYLMDAWQSSSGFLPFRDFLTKGPLYVIVLKLWQFIVPSSLPALRVLSIIAWTVAVWFTVAVAKALQLPPKGQMAVAVALSVLPAPVVLTVPLLLQTTSTALVVFGLWLVLRNRASRRSRMGVASAGVLAAAFFTRISSVVGMLVAGGALIFRRQWRTFFLAVGVGALLLGSVFVGGIATMGFQKTATMFNLEAGLISKARAVDGMSFTEPLLRDLVAWARVLWQAAPWLLATLLVTPLFFIARLGGWKQIVAAGLWVLLLSEIFHTLVDMSWLLPGPFSVGRLMIVAIVFALPVGLLVAILTRTLLVAEQRALMPLVWLAGAWLISLVTLYRVWGGFQQSYLVEFLPPLALLAGYVVAALPAIRNRVIAGALSGFFALSLAYGFIVVDRWPHTGTVELAALEEITDEVERQVPAGEEIFTAQPLVTVLAERPIVLGYSHPGWIRAARVGNVPDELRQIYFADADEITRHLREEAQFVLDDERTYEIYFDGFPERSEILATQFELIAEVENSLSEEPFRLYRRK